MLVLNGFEAEPLSGRAIAAFVAVVETGSLHGAADALRLTQSAVTKRIQALERRCGVLLLDRGAFGAQPTEIGRALYPVAKEALAALDRAAAIMTSAQTASAQRLKVAASHTIGEFLVPRWLAEFRAQSPVPAAALHSEVDIENSTRVLAHVRAGDVELGFVEGLDALRGLESMVLMHDELVVVVADGHRWAGRTISPADLAGEEYLTREVDSGTRAVVTAALERAGIELEPALVTPSIQALKRAVLSGGFTVLSRVAVEGEVLAGTLRTVTVRGVDLGRELRVVRSGVPAPGSAAHRLWRWFERGGHTGPAA